MLIYFDEPGTVGLQNNLRVIYDDTSTIAMLDFWVKFKEIELYVEHEWWTISLGSTVGEDNDSEVAGNEYAGDFTTSDGVDNVADEYFGDFVTSDEVDNVADEYAGDFATSNGLDNVATAPDLTKASYSPVAKCLQIKTFQDEHHCSASFKNKMVSTAMIAQHFEATIKNHSKVKLRKIQRRCASEMHVNVTIDCCYRAKKIVNEKMAGKHKDKFGLLWDYAHELRSKMSGSTIKMAVQRVTTDSLPHFKRFYVCFDALKGGWKAGCRPLIGLDG
ncbi:hypothetical protein PVK06_002077 [Gossypium arboreum]|uniref:Uncharacterized protein n=1 Tax=Gossypium arboreum TaxID=29729 RepID=A0ABR0R2T8_GOSAR|nr:hypothetical protein PVK06_002077 [Gossypium arboreum]